MAVVVDVFAVLSWLLALVWLVQAFFVIRGMPHVADLNQMDEGRLPVLPHSLTPHLAVIVPACNEEEHIRATLLSLLSSIGIRLQIIAVDDRSSDRTGKIMDEIAARTPHDSQFCTTTNWRRAGSASHTRCISPLNMRRRRGSCSPMATSHSHHTLSHAPCVTPSAHKPIIWFCCPH